jgi:hypothetical protein
VKASTSARAQAARSGMSQAGGLSKCVTVLKRVGQKNRTGHHGQPADDAADPGAEAPCEERGSHDE